MASFGENLRRERELRGVDLHEMADATKISFRFLQAIEQDRVDILPGGLFPRAFVRQYAKYLGLDPDRIVAEFVYAHGGEVTSPSTPAAVARNRADSSGGLPLDARVLGAGVLVLALVAFAAWQAVRGSRAPEPAASPVATPAAIASFPEDRVYPPPSATADTAVPGGFALTVIAQRNSWVDVKADGVTVINRVMSAGESQRIEARSAIALSVGNAGGVEYSVDGRPGVALGREGEVRRNVIFTPDSVRAGGPVSSPGPPRSPRPRRPSPEPTDTGGPAPAPSPTLPPEPPR